MIVFKVYSRSPYEPEYNAHDLIRGVKRARFLKRIRLLIPERHTASTPERLLATHGVNAWCKHIRFHALLRLLP